MQEAGITYNNDMLACLCASAKTGVLKKGEKLVALRNEIARLRQKQKTLPGRSLVLENEIAHAVREASALREELGLFVQPNG